MNKLISATPFATFAGIGVYALIHEFFGTAFLLFLVSYFCVGLLDTK